MAQPSKRATASKEQAQPEPLESSVIVAEAALEERHAAEAQAEAATEAAAATQSEILAEAATEAAPEPGTVSVSAMVRQAVTAHTVGGGDPWLTNEFEVLILALEEARNKLRAVLPGTEGELQQHLLALEAAL